MEPAESKRLISNTDSKANEGGGATALANRSATATSAMDALNAGASSVSDIEKLMAELLVARDYLQTEGERLRRVSANYACLAHSASASVRVIADSIGKWRTPDDQDPANPGFAVAAPALSPSDDG